MKTLPASLGPRLFEAVRLGSCLHSSAFICGLLILVSGCGWGSTKVHLSGTVTYEGKPVPAGEIHFVPDVDKVSHDVYGVAQIKNGRYDTRLSDSPVAPGRYQVRILGFDGAVAPEAPYGNKLFAQYRQKIEVSGPKDEKVDFDVPGKP